ncbi:MAG: TonB-dependent receptor [Gammaproteobacteria bacterium]|nr:TonB-dependent receptor [Gammaproteobacteria bacterium]
MTTRTRAASPGTMHIGCLFLLGTALGTGLPATTHAQAGSGGTEWLIEEITVTARKREEDLQSTPLSISAFSGESLEFRGVDRVDGIADFTPNLSFGNSPTFGGAGNSAAIYIRGIGQKEFVPTVDPGVGLYVDGVYIGRSVGGILDLIDIERVEVLRGPQGTLFGRNTIGGAISITTRKPGDVLAGRASATYGTDDRIDLVGSIDVPLADNLFSSFSVGRMAQDGYVGRPDGTNLGDVDTLAGRAALRWLASPALEVNFSLEGTRSRENGPAFTLIGIDKGAVINRGTGAVDPNTPPMALINNQMASFMAGWPSPGLGGPDAYPPCVFLPGAIPDVPSGINPDVPGCYDDRYLVGKGRNLGAAPAFSDTDIRAANLTLDWQISDVLSAKSISAYRHLSADFARDGDHSPLRVSQYLDDMHIRQFSQEFQLNGNSLEDRLHWVLGLYYFKESGNNENILDFVMSNFRSGGAIDNESKAVFAQATYDLAEQWHLTLGLRHTNEDKKFRPDQVILQNYYAGSGHPMLDAPFMQVGQRILPYLWKKQNLSETTPMANLAYDWTDDLMLYGSYSEGFKSGGFTQRVFPPIVAGFTAPPGTPDIDLIPEFEPEYVKVYELGFKYSTPGRGMRLNGALFHTKYDDLQVQVFTSVAPVTKNAASASINGFELEMQAVPADGWFVEASVGYLDAEYDRVDPVETWLFKSDRFERVPEWSTSAALSRQFELAGLGTLTPRIDWSWRSKVYNDSFNSAQLVQPSFSLVNFNLAFTDQSDRYDIVAAVRNLTDKEYMITGVWGTAFQTIEGIFDRGREYSLTARVRF